MIFTAEDKKQKLKEPIRIDLPEDVLTAAKYWFEFNPGGNLSDINPQPQEIFYTDEAIMVFSQFNKRVDSYIEDQEHKISGLWTRTSEKARKLALLYACSKNYIYPEVCKDAAEWACGLSEYLTRKTIYVASDWVSESKFDADCKFALRLIKEAGTKGMSGSEFCRKTKRWNRREREEVKDNLLASGYIRRESKQTKGSTQYTYYAT